MFPIFLIQIALLVVIVRSIYVVVKGSHSMSGLDIAFHISIAILAISFLFPHSYSYYIH
jgi:hypothetical protein